MSDAADLGNERAEQFLNHSIGQVKKPEIDPANGYCFNCDEPVAEGMRWCNADCCSDWQARIPKVKKK